MPDEVSQQARYFLFAFLYAALSAARPAAWAAAISFRSLFDPWQRLFPVFALPFGFCLGMSIFSNGAPPGCADQAEA